VSLCVAIVMEATSSPLVSQVTAAWLARCAAACSRQLSRDVAPIYGGTYGVRAASGPTDVQPGEMVFSIVDQLPDAPDAIAYHDTQGNDVPVAFLALSMCNTLGDVSTAISHELCETAGDISCDLWADDGQGYEWARELCDAVESNSYPIDLGDGQPAVPVSDFLLPGFFGASDPGPYSFVQAHPELGGTTQGVPSGPFATASGGYQVRRSSGGGETQVQGKVADRRLPKAKHWSSRLFRRGVRLDAFSPPVRSFNFSVALDGLKAGRRVARSGWNGKGMCVAMQFPDSGSKMGAPYLYLRTVQGTLVPWLPSQTDLLADDWIEVVR
jgi:hypothetical protein